MRYFGATFVLGVLLVANMGVLPSVAADSTPPKVDMTFPLVDGQVFPVTGFEVRGSARDKISPCVSGQNELSPISEVRVRVYDIGRGAFSVMDQSATYSEENSNWSFQVMRSDLTDGFPAIIGVQAEDESGNRSDWVYRKIHAGSDQEKTVPLVSSEVQIESRQLLVRRPDYSGVLGEATDYSIRGVTWNPATMAPDCGGIPRNPLASVPYGFFFDGNWRLPGPQGHELMGTWTRSQFFTKAAMDISLMKNMGVNTVRTFIDFGVDPQVFRPILDEFYRQGIMVILTVSQTVESLRNFEFVPIIEAYRNHPAILMWSLGNEWNYNFGSLYGINDGSFDDSDGWLEVLGPAAQEIKRLDPKHLVTTALIRTLMVDEIQRSCTDQCGIDLWGLNVYEGESFGGLFDEWADLTLGLPFYFSEFGTDAFRSDNFDQTPSGINGTCGWNPEGCAVNVSGSVDESMQAAHNTGLWEEIQVRLGPQGGHCLGGIIHTWNDELYLVGNYHFGLGGIIDYDGADNIPGTADDNTGYDVSSSEGFILAGGHPDNVANEEYFGQVNSDRNPREVYRRFQEKWAPELIEPELTNPTEDGVIRDSKVIFQWTPGVNVDETYLGVATWQGLVSRYPWGDLFSASTSKKISQEVSGIPLDGNTVYVRLWWRFQNDWFFKDYSFKTDNRPVLETPESQVLIDERDVIFSWSSMPGVEEYYLNVGSSAADLETMNGGDIFSASTEAQTSVLVTGIPLAGNPVFARLWWKIADQWSFTDYRFDTEVSVSPEMIFPLSDDIISTDTVNFVWENSPDNQVFYIGVGTSQRSVSSYPWGDLFSGVTGISSSMEVSNLPLSGKPIYVRLWWQQGRETLYQDFVYQTQSVVPQMLAPSLGDAIGQSSVRFEWTSESGVSEYFFGVGTRVEYLGRYPWGDIDRASLGLSTVMDVEGIPLNGQPIYVRLWWNINGFWQYTDYTYQTESL